MARSPVAIIAPRWPGGASAALVLLLTFGTLAAVAWQAEWVGGLSTGDWAAVRFTLVQAFVSAAVSVVLAVPVARALARRQFRGRGILITLLGAPFILPVIVAVIALLAVFGRNGVLNDVMVWIGLPRVTIYGFHGVVLAHVFLNLPLATRLLLQGWLSIPAERFRLAATLNADVRRLLEWPMLRATAPNAFLVIFVICLTSFATALILGGGPRATTVELAIYQALRFDFDLGRAALLACVQFGLCAAATVLVWRIAARAEMGAGLDRVVQRWDRAPLALDAIAIALCAGFLIVPLGMIVLRGAPHVADLTAPVWWAAGRSLLVASASACLCVCMALSLALWGGRVAAFVGVLPLAASSLVVGTGLFLIVYPFVRPAEVALPVTALTNATLALPFALHSIAPSVAAIQDDFGRLAMSLNMRRWTWVRLVVLPRMRRPLGFAAGLAAALSMGDLGVITLFAGNAQETLPLAMYRLMGAYQMDQAAAAALLLLALSLLLFWICDRGGRVGAEM